jgi:hypothetical protein
MCTKATITHSMVYYHYAKNTTNKKHNKKLLPHAGDTASKDHQRNTLASSETHATPTPCRGLPTPRAIPGREVLHLAVRVSLGNAR